MELSGAFEIVKYAIWIVFFGAIFFVVFGYLKRDYVKKAIQTLTGKKDQSAAYNYGFREKVQHYTQKPSSQPCENGRCSGKVKAPNHGSLMRNPDTGVRLIVCAECAPAYVKTGWIPEMTWGEEFKLSAIGLGLGAETLIGVPVGFVGLAPTSFSVKLFFVLARVAIYAIGALVIAYILGRDEND